MDVITTSIDALLQRATNPQNENIDTAAVEAFCAMVNREKDGVYIGIKLIASRIHSKHEKEVLQTLYILDTAMQKCGNSFQSEVGKFRFLNEMIKLVSPKYLGSHTPISIKQKVLQLLYLWTIDYPREIKIKEAYEMLRKQGVIREVPLSISADVAPERKTNSIFQDEEKSKILQKLLQSKNPEDLEAANRLIKSMVKEDDKRTELKSKRFSELESLQNNMKLLNEMLDSYTKGFSSRDEVDLIKELHETCHSLQARLSEIASETSQTDEISDILNAGDDLTEVLKKYDKVIKKPDSKLELLDLAAANSFSQDLLSNVNLNPIETSKQNGKTDIYDIFETPKTDEVLSILKPISVAAVDSSITSQHTDFTNKSITEKSNKMKALEDLDVLGENLLKENLQSSSRYGSQFNRLPDKVPMNLLQKPSREEINSLNLNLNCLLGNESSQNDSPTETHHSIDDLLVDITETSPDRNGSGFNNNFECEKVIKEITTEINKDNSEEIVESGNQLKLSDVNITLESIKPSKIPPIIALDEKNGLTVTFHFTEEKPSDFINVIVVTIASKKEYPIKNLLFRAIVPKVCKVKLQPLINTELPAFNPFLPATAVTQIILISNPENIDGSLKFIVSYNVDDETYTEMGEIDKLRF